MPRPRAGMELDMPQGLGVAGWGKQGSAMRASRGPPRVCAGEQLKLDYYQRRPQGRGPKAGGRSHCVVG